MRSDFSAVRRRILLQVVLVVAVAGAVGWFLQYLLIDGYLQDWFAKAFIDFCQRLFRVEYESARMVYVNLFRYNKTMWMSIGFCVLLMIAFYIGLSRFMRYFKEIGSAVNKLAEDDGGEVELSSELEFLENRINGVRQTLARRESEAREAEQKKNDLVVYLAHDIKTPLTSVIGYLSLLNESPDMPIEQRARHVKLALTKAYRLEQLIEEFFEITRFNLQTIQLNREAVDLNMMLMQIADEFYPLLQAQEKEATVRAEENLTVYADADKLARVLNNIIKNALSYGAAGTAIEIVARRREKGVAVFISNKGGKIPKEKLDQIFEKFYRLDEARSSNTGGAGLGLAIAREIVLAHGGEIKARSTDEKTTFAVLLPEGREEQDGHNQSMGKTGRGKERL